MGNSPAMYAAHKDHARKAYVAERALALFEAHASFSAVTEYYNAQLEVTWSLEAEDHDAAFGGPELRAAQDFERDQADDPAVNGDYEDPYQDLAEAVEYRQHPNQDDSYWAEQAEVYEADDRARDYFRDI